MAIDLLQPLIILSFIWIFKTFFFTKLSTLSNCHLLPWSFSHSILYLNLLIGLGSGVSKFLLITLNRKIDHSFDVVDAKGFTQIWLGDICFHFWFQPFLLKTFRAPRRNETRTLKGKIGWLELCGQKWFTSKKNLFERTLW